MLFCGVFGVEIGGVLINFVVYWVFCLWVNGVFFMFLFMMIFIF